MTPQVYSLSTKDGGGQYDVKAPVGAACADYKYFVNMVEPGKFLPSFISPACMNCRPTVCPWMLTFSHFLTPHLFAPKDGSLFCMRCCQTKEDCPVGKSTYGCRAVIDGKY